MRMEDRSNRSRMVERGRGRRRRIIEVMYCERETATASEKQRRTNGAIEHKDRDEVEPHREMEENRGGKVRWVRNRDDASRRRVRKCGGADAYVLRDGGEDALGQGVEETPMYLTGLRLRDVTACCTPTVEVQVSRRERESE